MDKISETAFCRFVAQAVTLPPYMVKLGLNKAHGDKTFASYYGRRKTTLHGKLAEFAPCDITLDDGAVFLDCNDVGLAEFFTIPAFNGETQTFHWLVCDNCATEKRVIIVNTLQEALSKLYLLFHDVMVRQPTDSVSEEHARAE